jgi:hypothetical protein
LARGKRGSDGDSDELEKRLAAADAVDKVVDELGPSYDCVCFNDGSVWRAALDVSEVRH